MLYSKLRFLNTSEQLRSVLPDIKEFRISSYLLGFSTFLPDPYTVFTRSVQTIVLMVLGQSILPILSSEITAKSAMVL